MTAASNSRPGGAAGALLDEYEKALKELYGILEHLTESELTEIVDPHTKDPDCHSIQSILSHVVSSGKNYVVYIRNSQGESAPRNESQSLDSATAYIAALEEVLQDNESLFVDYPQIDFSHEVEVPWSQTYDVDQLMEHAILHIMRHRRQIVRFLDKIRSDIRIQDWPTAVPPPMDLLLQADPSQELINSYVEESHLFGIFSGKNPVGICVLQDLDNHQAEIRNVSIAPNFQQRGLGQRLLQYAIEKAKALGFQQVHIATASSGMGQLYLYQKLGFRPISIQADHFVQHYPEAMEENGLPVRDQVILQLDLLAS